MESEWETTLDNLFETLDWLILSGNSETGFDQAGVEHGEEHGVDDPEEEEDGQTKYDKYYFVVNNNLACFCS